MHVYNLFKNKKSVTYFLFCRAFQPISLRINNLGDDAARHDGSDYKPVPEKKPEEPDAFTKLVEKLKYVFIYISKVPF